MADRVLALTKDGRMTWCTAPDDQRGRGRCPHVAHQNNGESVDHFISRMEQRMVEDDASLPDMNQWITEIIKNEGINQTPDYDAMFRNIPNPFTIGSEKDGTLETAELLRVDVTQDETGDNDHVVLHYRFRGEDLEADMGLYPHMQDDGTIRVNDAAWRFIPVVNQHKAGVVSYRDTVVVMQDPNNVALVFRRDDPDHVKLYGQMVPVETIQAHWRGEATNLTEGQKWALDHLDPAVEQRFPNFKEDPAQVATLPEDHPADLSWRRVHDYQDELQRISAYQMRRMGVTFRKNLAERQAAEGSGDQDRLAKAMDAPLMYQKNNTDNIRRDLIGASNVQYADNTNPIAALSQSQRISFTGPGGYNKDQVPAALRNVHSSHEGVLNTLDTSSGKNVGLTASLYGAEIGPDGMIHPLPDGDKHMTSSDFIPYAGHNDPNRAVMAVSQMKQALPITGGEDPIASTPAWDRISGAKLGVNMVTAYVPMGGVYEDAVVISESAAARMTTHKEHRYRVDPDSMGDIRVGQEMGRNQRFGTSGVKTKIGGVVTAVNRDTGVITVGTDLPLREGDKLSNRAASKGVVSHVLPDDQMPMVQNHDGNWVRADVVNSPLSISSRMNLGQVYEAGGGSVEGATKRVRLADGTEVHATAGPVYTMRLDQNAEEKLSAWSNEMDASRNSAGHRMGSMEGLILTSTEDRRKILNFIRHQEQDDSHRKLNHLMRAVGVDMTVNQREYY